ncbi:MAG: hypothetical protein PHQ96_04030 [Candidatus Omnitrophica bacterium]|nr:hypothetical protein [Candidatus Omnitrophota bacterium]
MRKKNLKKAQSVLEYILVSVAFATAGIATFVIVSRASVLTHRGLSTDYSGSTLTGQVIADPQNRINDEAKWQAPKSNITSWNEPQPEIDNRVTTHLVADSETHNSTWNQNNEENYVDNEEWRQEIPEGQTPAQEPGCEGPGCSGS